MHNTIIAMSYLTDNLGKYQKVEQELRTLQGQRRLTLEESFRLDRAMDIQQAARLGFEHAMYSGGIVEGTKTFCRNRNRKVFTIEQILQWKEAEDRPDKDDYDPFLDLGGNCCHPDQEHCQHRLKYISKEMAARQSTGTFRYIGFDESTFFAENSETNSGLCRMSHMPVKTCRASSTFCM